VSQKTGPDTDFVFGVERLQFADRKVALDLGSGEAAGNAARLIGATFDAPHISDLMGVATGLFDSGLSMVQVAQRALATDLFLSMAGSHSNADFVNTVYRNIMGKLPSPADRDSFMHMLQGSGGTMTQAELLVVAANSAENAVNIGLVGLQQSGVEFT
jgi:hypothetical protein